MSTVSLPHKLLMSVQKPSRYIGGEIGSVTKDLNAVDIRYCFCFPDVYDIGMSSLGLQILYAELNRPDNVYCERAFAPWPDMEEKMRDNSIPLYSLETHTPLSEFDILGFTLQYEMSYTNILNMLDLAGIPLFAKERGNDAPLIMAGGPNACNPEVLADFIDVFYIGEGEVSYKAFFEAYKAQMDLGWNKEAFLRKVALLDGFYVPSLYVPIYSDMPAEGCSHTGVLLEMKQLMPEAHPKKVVLDKLDDVPYPTKPIVPFLQVVHDRAAMEIFRGCLHGCRFCQAGMIYRPVRWHSREAIMKWVDEVLKNTGYDELSLTSLSSDDYPDLYEIIREIHAKYPKLHICLPSLRVDAFSLALMEELAQGKKSSLTFAAEAGTQRLRNVINKGIEESDVLNGVSTAFKGGFDKVKLYFMLGLPTESYEDIAGIATLSKNVVSKWYELPKEERTADVRVTTSTSFFVPKCFTPFQWFGQNAPEDFLAKQAYLTQEIRNKKITYDCHDAFLSVLEGIFARGDRRVGKLLYTAWKKGCKFDSWSDIYNEAAWKEAIEETGTELEFYCFRERPEDELFPWDHIDMGISKNFLLREYQRAKEGLITPPCNEKCNGCGMMKLAKDGICYEGRNAQ